MTAVVSWLRDKLQLRHLLLDTNPWLYLLKVMLVCALVLVLDLKATKQPDSITSLFTALLSLGPTVLIGTRAGLNIFIASMVGCAWGSLSTVVFHIRGDHVLHFDSLFLLFPMHTNGTQVCVTVNQHCSTYLWLLLARVPLGVCLTALTLFLIARSDPGSMASGLFSALYVQLLAQLWPFALHHPSTYWWNNNNVLSTIIVRIVATLCGVFAATLVNGLVAAFFMCAIFEKRLASIEHNIRNSIDLIDLKNLSVELLFVSLHNFLNDLNLALDEAKLRHMLYLDRLLGADEPYLHAMHEKVMVMYRLLSVQACVALLADVPLLDAGDVEMMKLILRASKKKHKLAFAERHLLYNMEYEKHNPKHREGIEFMRMLMLHFMDKLAEHDALSGSSRSDINPI